MKVLKVLFIGEKYFALKIIKSIKNYCNKNNIKEFKFYFTDTYKNIFGIIKYFFYLIKCDLLISIKGYITKKNEIEFAFLFKKKIIFFWIGSDVLKALDNFKRGKFSKKYIEKIKHFCEIEWIKEELKTTGLDVEILNFVSINIPEIFIKNHKKNFVNNYLDDIIDKNKELISKIYNSNKEFTLLTYINKYRPDFYGLIHILNLANDLLFEKNIKIIITGINENEAKSFLNKKNINLISQNIIFKGYIKEMSNEYLNSHVFLRIIEHDGLSTSVLEALSYGKHVVYSYDFPFVYKANNYDDLKNIILKLYEKFKNNLLTPNYDGLKFVLNNYSEDITNKKLIEFLSKF